MFKRTVAGITFGLLASGALGIAWFAATPLEGCNTPIASPATQLGYCILGAAGSDIVEAISDPVSLIPVIIAACSKYGVVTVDAIIATIEAYFGSAPVAGDAAVGVSSTQSAYEARLHKVLSAALTVAGVKVTGAK
jgi:hypothetical protein